MTSKMSNFNISGFGDTDQDDSVLVDEMMTVLKVSKIIFVQIHDP